MITNLAAGTSLASVILWLIPSLILFYAYCLADWYLTRRFCSSRPNRKSIELKDLGEKVNKFIVNTKAATIIQPQPFAPIVFILLFIAGIILVPAANYHPAGKIQYSLLYLVFIILLMLFIYPFISFGKKDNGPSFYLLLTAFGSMIISLAGPVSRASSLCLSEITMIQQLPVTRFLNGWLILRFPLLVPSFILSILAAVLLLQQLYRDFNYSDRNRIYNAMISYLLFNLIIILYFGGFQPVIPTTGGFAHPVATMLIFQVKILILAFLCTVIRYNIAVLSVRQTLYIIFYWLIPLALLTLIVALI